MLILIDFPAIDINVTLPFRATGELFTVAVIVMEVSLLPCEGLIVSQSSLVEALQDTSAVRWIVFCPPVDGKESAVISTEKLGAIGISLEQTLNKITVNTRAINSTRFCMK
jgi:hypothetical protein